MNGQENIVVHSTVVAKRFLEIAKRKKEDVRQVKLQKLVYFAHGWHLAIFGMPLTKDDPQAWLHGPLYFDLWKETRFSGTFPVKPDIKVRNPECAQLGKDQSTLIEAVYYVYGSYEDFELSEMTHQEGTPRYKVFREDGNERSEISRELIKEWFEAARRKD